MTKDEMIRIAGLVEEHAHVMREDPTHALLCMTMPCGMALCLNVITKQCRALAEVADVGRMLYEQSLVWPERTVEARQVGVVFNELSGKLHDLSKGG